MMKKSYVHIDIVEKVIITGIIVVAVFCRLLCVFNHFTHYDDVGFVASLLMGEDTIWARLHYRTLMKWTYAPLQCWMIGLLVRPTYSYSMNLFMGRLPSFLFSIINIFLTLYFVRKRYSDKEDHILERIISVFMVSFSWELIIYAAQCEPYSIGITGILVLIIEYYNIAKSKEISFMRLALIGGIVGYMQYQLYLLVFVFYISIFALFLRDKRRLLTCFLCSICSFIISIPGIINFLNYGLFDRGINWNKGIHGQYHFNIKQCNDLKQSLIYIVKFLVNNTLEFLGQCLYTKWVHCGAKQSQFCCVH